MRFKLLLLISYSLIILSCDTENGYSAGDNILETDVINFENTLITLDSLAQSHRENPIDVVILQGAVRDARLAYKRIEYLAAYSYPEFVKSHINGAPLPSVDKSGSHGVVKPPQGLQVLDELVYTDDFMEQAVPFSILAKDVLTYYQLLRPQLLKVNLNPQQTADALRMQLVRIHSLGLTGFDTPGSANGIAESLSSLFALRAYLEKAPKNERVYKKVYKKLNESIDYLELHQDFDTFDRVHFYREFLGPMYQITRVLGSKTLENNPWNPQSESIYAADFLSPYYYSRLDKSDDTIELRALGKALFYDTKLSKNGTMSCATCHAPEKAFTDGFTVPLNGLSLNLKRNTPTLINAVYADRYFYDLRAHDLEQQVEHVFFNQEEFNIDYAQILTYINKTDTYKNARSKTKDNSIDRQKIAQALSSFLISLNSWDSPVDKYMRNEDGAFLEANIINGMNLFMGKAACATCHFAPTFSGLVPPYYIESESEVLGVLTSNKNSANLDNDLGRYSNGDVRERAEHYKNSFKTVTVRNTALTAPYFHNGNYANLQEVMDFYNAGGGSGKGHDVPFQTLAPDPLELTDKEVNDIISFLEKLTSLPNISI